MSAAHGIAMAIVFGWLGMVVAISFIDAPLKFRVPGYPCSPVLRLFAGARITYNAELEST